MSHYQCRNNTELAEMNPNRGINIKIIIEDLFPNGGPKITKLLQIDESI